MDDSSAEASGIQPKEQSIADEQQDLIRLVRRYTDALDAQLAAVDTAEGESR